MKKMYLQAKVVIRVYVQKCMIHFDILGPDFMVSITDCYCVIIN